MPAVLESASAVVHLAEIDDTAPTMNRRVSTILRREQWAVRSAEADVRTGRCRVSPVGVRNFCLIPIGMAPLQPTTARNTVTQ